jgi:hypothetical protein
VGEDRRDRLLKAIKKAFDSKGIALNLDDVEMPMAPNSEGKLETKG